VSYARARRRAALGLREGIVPVSLYVPLGFLLGPRLLGVLPLDVLAHLDVAVTIALAALGVFIGLALAETRGSGRLLAAASIESATTVACVGLAAGFLLARWEVAVPSTTVVALSLGVCAAASAAGSAESGRPAESIAARVADLDDIVPIAASALVAGGVNATSGFGLPVMAAFGLPIAVGLAVAVIGWLLFERADGAGERAVFVLGALAMLGGAAVFLGVSPLLGGLVAGTAWRWLPGRADRIIAEDLRKFHHPLVLLLLIDAGARLAPGGLALWLLVPFVIFRMTGKVLGGWAAARVVPDAPADVMSTHLVPPGVVGIAIALNLVHAIPEAGSAILTAAAIGAVVFEIVAFTIMPRRQEV
jgi:hypothetical protein